MYMYLALRRNKENDSYDGPHCFRELNRHGSDQTIDTLRNKVLGFEGTWRIYRSVNERNLVKASKMLQKAFIDDEVPLDGVDSKWKSILMKNDCRQGKRWLLDIDTKEPEQWGEVLDYVKEKGVEIFEDVMTPNGRHLVVQPFDPRDMKFEYVDIKKDDLVFVDIIHVEK